MVTYVSHFLAASKKRSQFQPGLPTFSTARTKSICKRNGGACGAMCLPSTSSRLGRVQKRKLMLELPPRPFPLEKSPSASDRYHHQSTFQLLTGTSRNSGRASRPAW